MQTLLAFPSTASFAEQAALAFHERGALAAYMTSFAYHEEGVLARVLAAAPDILRTKIEPQLKRRAIKSLPRGVLEQRPFWEVVRTIADKGGLGAPMVDRIWDHHSHDFTRAAARRLARGGIGALYAYEYTALEAFRAAERRGIARVLDFPSLNSRRFEELQRREKERFPELMGPNESYFNDRFERRQARRDEEMRAADVIVTNSSVTRRSHIEGGADPQKTFSVPYGAPPAITHIAPRGHNGPLRVIWAGTFSIRKGAHYFIEAWQALGARDDAISNVYGAVTLPERLWKPMPAGLVFHGSVPRGELFKALDRSDVLIFPSLSDGFGMVVTEAFSRGLPVITTDQAGASDLVEHGRNGLIIEAGNAPAIAQALKWCLNNRTALASMREPALITAKGWQWSDYRTALIEAVSIGLARAGYAPLFGGGADKAA